MSKKIKNSKGGKGAWNIPNKGKVWKANWTDDVDAPKENLLKFEYYPKEKKFDSSKIDDSAVAENRIADFYEHAANRIGLIVLKDRGILRKAA